MTLPLDVRRQLVRDYGAEHGIHRWLVRDIVANQSVADDDKHVLTAIYRGEVLPSGFIAEKLEEVHRSGETIKNDSARSSYLLAVHDLREALGVELTGGEV